MNSPDSVCDSCRLAIDVGLCAFVGSKTCGYHTVVGHDSDVDRCGHTRCFRTPKDVKKDYGNSDHSWTAAGDGERSDLSAIARCAALYKDQAFEMVRADCSGACSFASVFLPESYLLFRRH